MDKYSAIDLREMGKSITIVLPSSFSLYIDNNEKDRLQTCTIVNRKYGESIESTQEKKRKTIEEEFQCNDITPPCSITSNSKIKCQKTEDNTFRIFNGQNDDFNLPKTSNIKIESDINTIDYVFENQRPYPKEKSCFEEIQPTYKSTTNNLMNTSSLLDFSDFNSFDDEDDDDVIEIFRTPPAKLQATTNPTNPNYINKENDYICPICDKKCF